MTMPYYLGSPSEGNPTAPLTSYWQADPSKPAPAGTLAPVGAPCAVLAPSVSTTTCYPMPKEQSEQTIPVLVTIPNDNSGKTMRSEEHTSELQSLMRISYAVFCLKKKKT